MNVDLVPTVVAWIWVAAGAVGIGFGIYLAIDEDLLEAEVIFPLFLFEAMWLAATSSVYLPLSFLGFPLVALWTWRIVTAIGLAGTIGVVAINVGQLRRRVRLTSPRG